MNTEILGIIAQFLMAVVLSIPLGKYIAAVYANKPTFLDGVMKPVERLLLKTARINPKEQMNWKQHLQALLTINIVWLVMGFLLLMYQNHLPLNPDHNPGMSPALAFNTIISFVVNCNLQHYSGETCVGYLAQVWLMFLQFVSAATGMAAAAALFEAFRSKTTALLGNFYVFMVKSVTRILLPLSIMVAVALLFQGIPMTFSGKGEMQGLEGQTVEVSTGPVAAFVAIKHLGTNGGGYFGTNSAHPFENPTYFSNMVEMVAQMLIPLAMLFAFGIYTQRRKFAWMMFGVMTVGFLCLTIPNVYMEMQGNPVIRELGINDALGAMEGKEIRIGAAASGFWSIATTVISTGSINAMHDSTMPLSGMNQLLAMMVNSVYGGVGVGILNFFVFVILAVFIGGLMVGRTPEIFGKKIEAREMKIAMLITLLHPFLILAGTALAVATPSLTLSTLNNPSYHGFSEMLYEFTSAAANNGSGFEGLGDNTAFWNITTGVVLLLGRYLPIIGPVAIAGILANKKYIPEGSGTLSTDNMTFGTIVFAIVFIVAALAFFPALTLGPIADYFSTPKF